MHSWHDMHPAPGLPDRWLRESPVLWHRHPCRRWPGHRPWLSSGWQHQCHLPDNISWLC